MNELYSLIPVAMAGIPEIRIMLEAFRATDKDSNFTSIKYLFNLLKHLNPCCYKFSYSRICLMKTEKKLS